MPKATRALHKRGLKKMKDCEEQRNGVCHHRINPIEKKYVREEDFFRRGAKLDRYEIREWIGRGGMGEVYRAWDAVVQRDVALKVLTVREPDMVSRFQREAEAIGRLASQNVVEIHDFKMAVEPPYIVMEYLRGISLLERLTKQGAMSIEETVGVGLAVCRGVAACHRVGLVHRDIKPANVFLSENPHYGTVVKVLDFGVSKPMRLSTDSDGPWNARWNASVHSAGAAEGHPRGRVVGPVRHLPAALHVPGWKATVQRGGGKGPCPGDSGIGASEAEGSAKRLAGETGRGAPQRAKR